MEPRRCPPACRRRFAAIPTQAVLPLPSPHRAAVRPPTRPSATSHHASNNMEYVIGIVAATAVGLFATVVGFDKERSFYPVVLIVIAALYLLFAAMAASAGVLVTEAIPALVFVAMAVVGFRRKAQWIVVAGLALHGVFDFFHHAVIANPGVPAWWPGWCLAYDVVAAGYLAALVLFRRNSRAGA